MDSIQSGAVTSLRYKLGCDIGGTFTDFLLFDQTTGEILVEKCLTTPFDPSAGVLNGIRQLAERRHGFLAHTESILHATTLVINAVIERKGARTALITTKGFRDILEIAREMRYDIYDVFLAFPKPLVPRYLRQGVTERTYYDGSVGVPLDYSDVVRAFRVFQENEVESVAVCFLHSYANATNEQAVRTILAELAPDLPVSLSSEVLPEIREYERTSTTVVNAYARPLISRYIGRLREGLREMGFKNQLLIMLSSGGMTTAQTASLFPVRIIESGPAAGSIAAAKVGTLAGYSNVLAFDMGGTTAKGCLIRNGMVERTCASEIAREHRFKKGSGIPVNVPFVDLVEIGAGGGSIAHVGDMGLMQVGPESASASPGPACYGLGGQQATVSDADLLLGYLNPSYFLGGNMLLDECAARNAIEKLATSLKLTVEKAAAGIHQLVTENMAVAMRIHMADKGVDPGELAMFAFGGAGPIHACALAKRLGIRTVLIPPAAGIASALGLLVAPMSFDQARTYRRRLGDVEMGQLEVMFQEMERIAHASIAEAEGGEAVTFSRSLDLSYAGQSDTISVPLEALHMGALSTESIRHSFAAAYRALYSRAYDDMEVQLVNLRVTAESRRRPLTLPKYAMESREPAIPKGGRQAYSWVYNRYVEHRVYDRYALIPGARIRGPAIVEERESTTILDAYTTCDVDEYKILIITLESDSDVTQH